MSYLIDTNVISEVRKGPRCDIRVSAWYASIADQDIFLSTLVLLRPVAVIHGLLAATAMIHGRTLATRNDRHVAGLGATVFNPLNSL